MAVRKKQSKFGKFIQERGKWFFISTIIFLVIGIVALFVGFGLQYGFLEVLKWFGSRWAIIIYVAVAIFAFIAIWVYHQKKMKE